jgi:FixJ family two-component response regulator
MMRWTPMETVAEIMRPHVYLIEADDSVRDSVRMLGDVIGFEVTCFSSAEAFLAASGGALDGHVVCAAELPGLDGIALYRALRNRDLDPPFALLISRADGPLQRAARAAGIASIIEKPRADSALLEFIALPHEARA